VFGFTKTRDLSFLILPAVILILIFNYLPMLGIVLAFKNYKYNLGIFGSPFAGFDNFKYFFTSQDAWRVTRNTVGYNVVFIITVIAGAVAIAILLNEVRKAVLVKAYQTVFFFPYFLSWPVVAILLYALLNTDLGIVNNIIKMCGGAPVDWYFTAGKWVYIMPLLNFWKSVGYNVIVF
jgi:putative aldouronate transport system permease protein